MIVVTYLDAFTNMSTVIANMKATREEFDRQFEKWEKVRGSDVPLVFYDFRLVGGERTRSYVIRARYIRSIVWAENVAEPPPLVDRRNAALAAARVGGNHEAIDAIIDTMTMNELMDLNQAAHKLEERTSFMADRKEERDT